MVLNNKFEAPYNKFAPEGSVPIISKALVKSRLSNKFFENTNFNSGTSNDNSINISPMNQLGNSPSKKIGHSNVNIQNAKKENYDVNMNK
jgi:hypothetical protein